ncbi:MAG: DUF3168 domain-containing protein [Steroidobacteraceae bacterium]|nr:DUF3168 domain-containing protein [Steroidobacteraceae bacterium]MDW8260766.1 DUF3168 domain-containing protein [Gammaproteobacteria bacterium]
MASLEGELAIALRSRLATSLAPLLPEFVGQPAVFAVAPVPRGAPLPHVWLGSFEAQSAGGLNFFRWRVSFEVEVWAKAGEEGQLVEIEHAVLGILAGADLPVAGFSTVSRLAVTAWGQALEAPQRIGRLFECECRA